MEVLVIQYVHLHVVTNTKDTITAFLLLEETM